jgi:hypothetical protein
MRTKKARYLVDTFFLFIKFCEKKHISDINYLLFFKEKKGNV